MLPLNTFVDPVPVPGQRSLTSMGRTGTATITRFDGNTIQDTVSMKTYKSQLKKEVVVTNGSFNVPAINL